MSEHKIEIAVEQLNIELRNVSSRLNSMNEILTELCRAMWTVMNDKQRRASRALWCRDMARRERRFRRFQQRSGE